jgi:hypothetical protein
MLAMNTDVTTDARPALSSRKRSGQTQYVSERGIAYKNDGGIQVVVSLQDVLIVFVRFTLKLLVELCKGILARVGQLQRRCLISLRVETIAGNHPSISHRNAGDRDGNIPFRGGGSGGCGYGVLFRHARLPMGAVRGSAELSRN